MLQSLLFFLVFSEGTNQFQAEIDNSIYCSRTKQVTPKLDHAMIEYDDMTASIYYKIRYSPKQLHVNKDAYLITNKTIDNKDTIKILQSYLEQFFVDKTEKIELKRTEIEGPITGEYSTIKITLYFKNGETEIFSSTIGSQDYIIEYNPKFRSFLRFIGEIGK